MKEKVAVSVPELTPEIKRACAAYTEKAMQAKKDAIMRNTPLGGVQQRPSQLRWSVTRKISLIFGSCSPNVRCQRRRLPWMLAETMRVKLKLDVDELPSASLLAIYELHRANKAALFLAGSKESEIKAVEKKVKELGKRIASGEASLRDVRKAFADEMLRARQQRTQKGSGSKRKRNSKILASPTVRSLAMKELTTLVESLTQASDESFSAVSIRPAKPTLKSVDACLADPKTRAEIVANCPSGGGFWIYVDMTPEQNVKPAAAKTASDAAA